MKYAKRLLPALCLLLVSAILMGTSTYAWLAMNVNVTATGMKVSLNTESVYLQISTQADKFDDPANVADFQDATAKEIKPATPVLDAGKIALTSVGLISGWKTAVSSNPDEAQTEATQYDIADGDVSKYVYSKPIYVKVVANSGVNGKDLIISAITTEGATKDFDKSLRVAVAGADGIQVWTHTTGTWKKDEDLSSEKLLAEVTTTVKTLTIYIWYEGTDGNCKTNNAADLSDISFTITFSIADPSAT